MAPPPSPMSGLAAALEATRDVDTAADLVAKRCAKLGYPILIARRLALPGLHRLASTLFAASPHQDTDTDHASAVVEKLARSAPWTTNALDLDELARQIPETAPPLADLGLKGGLLVPRVGGRQGRLLFLIGRAEPGSSAAHRPALLEGIDAFVEWMARHPETRQAQRTRLTEREREILAIAADGLTHEAIAERLTISVSGVMSRLRSAQRKLAARNRSQAIARAIWLGEIPVHIEPLEQAA